MSKAIYKQYDQASLDREYNNRAKVANFEEYLELYASESAKTRETFKCGLDVPFGDSADELLDIFFPHNELNDSSPLLPIHVFFHGGYWKALSKNEFSFVANAFAPKNAITIVVNYALIPEITMSALIDQCRKSLVWVWSNADSFHGDKNRINISGHSAGGHIVAMLMATHWRVHDNSLPADLIKSGCGISGLYNLEPIRLCFLNDDLNLSEQDVVRNSPVRQNPDSMGNLVLPLGALEGDEFLSQSNALVEAWRTDNSQPSVVLMPEQDHFSIVWQLNSPNSDLSTMIHRQLKI